MNWLQLYLLTGSVVATVNMIMCWHIGWFSDDADYTGTMFGVLLSFFLWPVTVVGNIILLIVVLRARDE